MINRNCPLCGAEAEDYLANVEHDDWTIVQPRQCSDDNEHACKGCEEVAWCVAEVECPGCDEILTMYVVHRTPCDDNERIEELNFTHHSMTIDTGDYIYHYPSREKWVVAYVQGEYLVWCGWPQGEAQLSNCVLLKKATPEKRLDLLKEMAAMPGNDPRQRYAQRRLEQLSTS